MLRAVPTIIHFVGREQLMVRESEDEVREAFDGSDGRPLALTRVEFRLLRKLLEQPGRVFSRQHLLDSIYEDYRVVSDRTVDSHVKNLRRKLQQAGVDPIASVYGVGYRYEPPGRDG